MEFSKQVDNINNFIISKLAEGYTINCFKNSEIKDQYYASNKDNSYDIVFDSKDVYKRFRIIANILEAQGLARDLSVSGGFSFLVNDKTVEVLNKLADKINDPTLPDIAIENFTKAVIYQSFLDEAIHYTEDKFEEDKDNNGIPDCYEDLDGNGVKDVVQKEQESIEEQNKELDELINEKIQDSLMEKTIETLQETQQIEFGGIERVI